MTRSEFLLVAQRALLGEITPNLRSVSGHVNDHVVSVRYIFDGEMTESDQERLSCVSTEIIAATLAPWMLDEQFIQVATPAPISAHELPYLVYRRHEPA